MLIFRRYLHDDGGVIPEIHRGKVAALLRAVDGGERYLVIKRVAGEDKLFIRDIDGVDYEILWVLRQKEAQNA